MAGLSQSQQAFVDRFAPYANLASQQTGLPSRVILAKLAIESQWGEKMFGNNIAGLKIGNSDQNAYSSGSGRTATKEFYGGVETPIKDGFLKYNSPEEGIGGFVSFLNNSTYLNELADRSGGGVFDADPTADQAAINAINSSKYSTDINLVRTLPDVLGRIPNLGDRGIAGSFSPAVNQVDQFSPLFNPAADYSQGLGPILSNDYFSRSGFNDSYDPHTTEFQPQGRVLSREEANGLALPSPQMGPIPQASDPLTAFSDAITGGLNSAGNAIGGAFAGAGNALNQGLGNLFGGGPAQAAAFNPDAGAYAFGNGINPFGGNALSGGGYNPSNLYGMPLPPSFYAPGGGIQTPDPIANPGFDAAQAQGVDTGNLFGAAYPQAAPSYGAPDLAGMFGGGAGIFNGGGGYSPGGFYGGQGAFNIGGFGAVPQFGGMPSVDAGTLGPGQTAGTLGPDQSADPFGAGAAVPPVGFGGQAVQPYGFNGFGGRSIFNGAQALPYGFGGALAPTLGFNGTDAATLGPDQSATATDQAPAPDPFGFSGLNLGGGAGQTFGGLYGVPTAPAFNPFGGSQYGLFGAGLNPSAGIGAQTFNTLYGLPGLPASTNASTLGADPTATLGPDASVNPFGFNGDQVQPASFNGASAMPYGFGGFNARTLSFGGQQAFPGFFGTDAQTLGPDQSATAIAPAAPAPGPFGFGGLNFGAGLGAQPQTFGGLYGMPTAPAAPAYNPFGGGIGGFGGFGGFGSGFDASGGLGATPQSFGSLFSAPAAPAAPAPAVPAPNPFGGFGPTDGTIRGNGVTSLEGSGGANGSAFVGDDGTIGVFDPQASENAFLRGQMANNAAMQQAGQAPQASNPNLYPSLFASIAPTPTNGTSYIAPQPSYAPAPGFSAPVSYAAPQVSLMMAAPQISLPTMNFSGGGFGGLGGFL